MPKLKLFGLRAELFRSQLVVMLGRLPHVSHTTHYIRPAHIANVTWAAVEHHPDPVLQRILKLGKTNLYKLHVHFTSSQIILDFISSSFLLSFSLWASSSYTSSTKWFPPPKVPSCRVCRWLKVSLIQRVGLWLATSFFIVASIAAAAPAMWLEASGNRAPQRNQEHLGQHDICIFIYIYI